MSLHEKLIPDVISECSIVRDAISTGGDANDDNNSSTCTRVCSSKKIIEKISNITNYTGSPDKVIEKAKQITKCDTEKCVLEKLQSDIGHAEVKSELMTSFKVEGPTNDGLLSNINIDAIMRQFAHRFKHFYPYNFHMRDFKQYSINRGRVVDTPDTFVTMPFASIRGSVVAGETLSSDKILTAGCVINTDVYSGQGKHWMAIFIDTRSSVWTIEFFDSCGGTPLVEYVDFLVETKIALEELISRQNLPNTVKIVKLSTVRHQRSKTECGLYSLFFIYSRLNGIPADYFLAARIEDKTMFEFRHHLFNDPDRPMVKKFEWDKYQREVNIQWE